MSKKDAEIFATAFRNTGYDVSPNCTPLGWELRCRAADGERDFFAFSYEHAKSLMAQGKIRTLPRGAS